MEIKILLQKSNPLLQRKEIAFEIENEKNRGTPLRLNVRQILATMLKTELEFIYVKKMETKTGTSVTVGDANVYDSIKQAQLIESKYIISRNSQSNSKKKEK